MRTVIKDTHLSTHSTPFNRVLFSVNGVSLFAPGSLSHNSTSRMVANLHTAANDVFRTTGERSDFFLLCNDHLGSLVVKSMAGLAESRLWTNIAYTSEMARSEDSCLQYAERVNLRRSGEPKINQVTDFNSALVDYALPLFVINAVTESSSLVISESEVGPQILIPLLHQKLDDRILTTFTRGDYCFRAAQVAHVITSLKLDPKEVELAKILKRSFNWSSVPTYSDSAIVSDSTSVNGNLAFNPAYQVEPLLCDLCTSSLAVRNGTQRLVSTGAYQVSVNNYYLENVYIDKAEVAIGRSCITEQYVKVPGRKPPLKLTVTPSTLDGEEDIQLPGPDGDYFVAPGICFSSAHYKNRFYTVDSETPCDGDTPIPLIGMSSLSPVLISQFRLGSKYDAVGGYVDVVSDPRLIQSYLRTDEWTTEFLNHLENIFVPKTATGGSFESPVGETPKRGRSKPSKAKNNRSTLKGSGSSSKSDTDSDVGGFDESEADD